MRVPCHLREIRERAQLGIRDIAETSGINRGTLSMLELGRMLPKDDQIPALERAYGKPIQEWYPPQVLLAITVDDQEHP